ncbi:hypothetical protein, partial [Nonlabens dokdonensis]
RPTYFSTSSGPILAGENSTASDPELIIDRKAFKSFAPDFKQSLMYQIRRAKGYESGMYQDDSSVMTRDVFFNSGSSDSTQMENTLMRIEMLLNALHKNGVIAYMSKDMRNTQDLQDELDRLQKLRNNNRV